MAVFKPGKFKIRILKICERLAKKIANFGTEKMNIALRKNAYLLENYAFRVEDIDEDEESSWIQYFSENGDLRVELTSTAYFCVYKGNLILENIYLPEAKDLISVSVQNDCELVVETVSTFPTAGKRKFLIHFNEEDGLASRNDCVKKLEAYIPINASQIGSYNSDQSFSSFPAILASSFKDYTDDQLEKGVISCLLDAEFPRFVDRVQKCLQKVTKKSSKAFDHTDQNQTF